MYGKKRTISILILLAVVRLSAQAVLPLSFSVVPGAEVPLGPVDAFLIGGIPYSLGYGAEIRADYFLPFAPVLFLRGSIGYSLFPVIDVGATVNPDLSVVGFGGSMGFGFTFLDAIAVSIAGGGGYYLGILGPQVAGNGYFIGGADLNWLISPFLRLGAGADYKYYLTGTSTVPGAPTHLYDGLSVHLGISFSLGAEKRQSSIKFTEPKLQPIFPVFYRYYDTNPFGTIGIRNGEPGTIRNVKVSFYVREYMDQPKLCATFDSIGAGDTREIPLFALLKDSVLKITEGTKAGGEVQVEYEFQGLPLSDKSGLSVEFLYRNAMIWDDNRKAAAFVTAKDPDILQYAKQVVGGLPDREIVSKNLMQGVALFESLGAYGMKYVVDPNSSYAVRSQDKFTPDFLQFPMETLIYKAGDCDDLSILYASFLESVGVKAAFLTVPKHILTAFSLGISEKEARVLFNDPSMLVFDQGEAWVPVEVTVPSKSFREAWSLGAEVWRKGVAQGAAAFNPVEAAWSVYPPVARPIDNKKIDIPPKPKLMGDTVAELDAIAQAEIRELEKKLKEGNPGDNRLGILYARYGVYEKAVATLAPLADKKKYIPSQVNLANVYYLQGKYSLALAYYTMAAKSQAAAAVALAGVVRTQIKLKNPAAAEAALKQLEKISPETARELKGSDAPKPKE